MIRKGKKRKRESRRDEESMGWAERGRGRGKLKEEERGRDGSSPGAPDVTSLQGEDEREEESDLVRSFLRKSTSLRERREVDERGHHRRISRVASQARSWCEFKQQTSPKVSFIASYVYCLAPESKDLPR